MLTARRLTVYTHDRSRLTPRQRRRAVHKANRLDAKARAVALAAIAVLVAGCSAGGGHATGPTRSEAGPTPVRYRLAAEYEPTTTTTVPTTVVAAARSSNKPRRSVGPTNSGPPKGGDFWERLSACESPKGASGRYVGYFQFSHENAARYGISGDSSYEQQKAAAQDLAAHSDPHHQWPVCWSRAGG